MTSIRDLMPAPPQPFTGTPWFDVRFASFDLETTSPDPDEARIVAAAAIEIGGRRPTSSRAWLVDPGVEIPAGATAVHGITTEQAQEVGELPGDAIPQIVEALTQRPAGAPLVIVNANYDLTVLDRECARYGVTPLQDRGELLVVDPYVIDRRIDRYRPGKRNLAAMCAHYRLGLEEDAHDAVYDARLGAHLARRICRDALVVRRDEWERIPLQEEWDRLCGDARALHAAQVDWYAEQARGLREHFLQEGRLEEAAEVCDEWPIRPARGRVA